MSGRRSVSRVRTRRQGPPSPLRSPERMFRDLELDEVDPARMLEYLRATGHLPDADLGPPGSRVPAIPTSDEASERLVRSMEAMFQRVLTQATPVAPVPAPSTAPSVPTPPASTSGKPHLKFPDPPMFEGDARLLDGWLTQSEMFLRAYNVDLSTSRSVDVATMFLRGKAQDWWTGQFHLIAAGSIPALTSWHAFVAALTEAFRPVELSRTYVTQLLSISQGKQDMRGYIASFNALRAKIPHAFPEETLSLLFLQGCRPDLQRHISLLYPKSLAEHFQHAITISDIPVSSRPPAAGGRSTGTAREADSSLKKALFCDHCKRTGHTQERCFKLHPELRTPRIDKKKTQH